MRADTTDDLLSSTLVQQKFLDIEVELSPLEQSDGGRGEAFTPGASLYGSSVTPKINVLKP
jgi:hypothetical protein